MTGGFGMSRDLCSYIFGEIPIFRWSSMVRPDRGLEETLVPQPEFVEEEVKNPATPMPEASPTSPEEEEAPHLPDAPPARILRHVDHIELMLDVMGLDGLFRNNPSSHWMRCLTTKFRHLAKKLHPDKPGGSAAQTTTPQVSHRKWTLNCNPVDGRNPAPPGIPCK